MQKLHDKDHAMLNIQKQAANRFNHQIEKLEKDCVKKPEFEARFET